MKAGNETLEPRRDANIMRIKQLHLPERGVSGRELSEREPGRGVKAREGTGTWTVSVQMNRRECQRSKFGITEALEIFANHVLLPETSDRRDWFNCAA
jgi:hypothetical protein